MRNLKCLGTGLGLAFLASVMIAMPSKAASYEYVDGEIDDTYVVGDEIDDTDDYDTPYFYMKELDPDREILPYDENLDLVDECKLTKDSLDGYICDDYEEWDNIFSDEESKAYVERFLGYNYLVLDLGADYKKTGNNLGNEEYYFDNGVKIIRNAYDDSFCKYICKCSYNDFKSFASGLDNDWKVDENNKYHYTQDYIDEDGEIYGYGEIKYDKDKEIMTYLSVIF